MIPYFEEQVNAYKHLTPGRKVRRYTKNGKKKVWIFRPIDVFNFGFLKSDDLVILTIYGILAWKDRQFFCFSWYFQKTTPSLKKTTARKIQTFLLPKNRPTFRPGIRYQSPQVNNCFLEGMAALCDFFRLVLLKQVANVFCRCQKRSSHFVRLFEVYSIDFLYFRFYWPFIWRGVSISVWWSVARASAEDCIFRLLLPLPSYHT